MAHSSSARKSKPKESARDAARPEDCVPGSVCCVGQAIQGAARAQSGKLLVLVVEDEPLISVDLCDTLIEADYRVMGPARTVAKAMVLLEQETPHLAIIDVLLTDGACTELANRLRERGVPFFIHSGYGQRAEEISGLAGERWLAKPAMPGEIIGMLGELLQQESASHAEAGKREMAK